MKESKKISMAAAGALLIHLIVTMAARLLLEQFFGDGTAYLIFYIVSSSAIVAASYFTFKLLCKRMNCADIPQKNTRRLPASVCVAIVFFVGFLIYLCGFLYALLFPSSDSATVPEAGNVFECILFFAAHAVVPTVAEEILFRGCFTRRFLIFGRLSAVIFSSLLFALAHFSFSSFPFMFISGIVIASAYLYSEKIIVPMGIHFVNNFLCCIMSLLSARMPEGRFSIFAAAFNISIAVITVILGIILLTTSKKPQREKSTDGSLAYEFITPAMVIYFICAFLMHFVYGG